MAVRLWFHLYAQGIVTIQTYLSRPLLAPVLPSFCFSFSLLLLPLIKSRRLALLLSPMSVSTLFFTLSLLKECLISPYFNQMSVKSLLEHNHTRPLLPMARNQLISCVRPLGVGQVDTLSHRLTQLNPLGWVLKPTHWHTATCPLIWVGIKSYCSTDVFQIIATSTNVQEDN